ncbi:polynucleotide 5'-hydroxyl-kinase NOL9 [Drosophila santomea]|uniref:polynucleotide 5'-hydroxyl-kinase NOL9 n=1 Tax=Drosophila santomea TaxID=129105 RepID=UPI001953372D|nr:polynucleotide 5'-hydroxyl-kinase NOL9 [Drosophila santomea]
MLNEHMLKEMQLSFQLTEQREIASGRRKPETPQHRPAAPKQKVISKVVSNPAKISEPMIKKAQMESPNKSKKNKTAGKKRPLFNKESKPESPPCQKRLKKDTNLAIENPVNKSQTVAAKKSATKIKSPKLPSPKAHKINESDQKKPKVKTPNKAKEASLPKKQKANGDKSSKTLVQNGQLVKTFKINGTGVESRDLEMNSMDDWSEEDDYLMESGSESDVIEEIDETFLKDPKVFKVKSKGKQIDVIDILAPFEVDEYQPLLLEGDGSGTVQKIKVFRSAQEEIDSDEEDNDYEPQDSEDSVSEEFDSEESDSEDTSSADFDSNEDFYSEDSEGEEEFDVDDDFDSEDSDSEEFGSDIFDSDDLDSTYEPPDIEGFFDDPPLGMQREPLIIEEIFDDPPVGKNQKELVSYKPKVQERIKESCAVEIVAKHSIVVPPEEDSIEETPNIAIIEPEAAIETEENAEVPLPEVETPEKQHDSQPSDTAFYRNPQANRTELSVFENSLKSNHVLAVIKEDLEVYGTLVLTLLSGQVSVNGYKARRQEPITVYSPKGLNWVSISPTKTKKPPKDEVNWDELNKNFTRVQLDRIKSSFQSQANAIVLLHRNTSAQRLVDTFGKHMSQNVFPLVNPSNRPFNQSETLLHCLIQSSDLSRTLQVPQVWNKLKVHATSRIIVAGGKGVGKSSLLRYLINRNLGQFPSVLLIDLDIGQPEIFVPQTISCTVIDEPLLGPGFLYNRQPEHAIVVGHTNIVLCAEQYARAVIQLVQNIQNDAKYSNIPWLINTMGYNKGFGIELMALLVDRIRPTDLVQIASPIPINNFDSALDWSSLSQIKPIIYSAEEFRVKDIPKYSLHKLLSAVPAKEKGTWSLSAKDMRYSNLLTRLSSCLTGNAKSLTDCQPLGVPLESLKILHPTSKDYTREELIRGMEANVVYLCNHGAGLPQCLGIGVVRAIDYDRKELFLVPAMPLQKMSQVDCLILGGELTLPQGYFRDQGQDVSSSVPFVFILDDSKSSKSIQQIYHRSPAFLGVPPNQRNGN